MVMIMKKFYYINLLAFFLILVDFHYSNAQVACDSLKHCTLNVANFTVTSGKGAHYVDVSKTSSLEKITNAMTLEMWVKAKKQAGKTQFLGGIWGPAEDVNDVWVLYINKADELVFEINGTGTNLRSTDNTIAKVNFAPFYDKWHHISTVFDGATQTIQIIINGYIVATGRNNQYPANSLRKLQNDELGLQIGSTNALSNDFDNQRTFLGQMDEIRLWARTFTDSEIYCQKDKSLEGNEKDLVLYYRCNHNQTIFTLCDATGNGNWGRLRSGMVCIGSDRYYNKTLFVEPVNGTFPLVDTLKCTNTKTFNFIVKDTSGCNKTSYIRVRGDYYQNFTVTPARIDNMEKGREYPVTVTLNANFTGQIISYLQVYNANRCQDWNNMQMKISRINELSYAKDTIFYDSLKVGCIQAPYHDSVLKICNLTQQTGTPRKITISKITLTRPDIFKLVNANLPIEIEPGKCFDLIVRFTAKDTTGLITSNMTIESDDACQKSMNVPLVGFLREVIGIYRTDGKSKLDSINFGTSCVNFPSDAVQFIWSNLFWQNIQVDSIIFPENFLGVRYRYPVVLEPKTGYMPDYFRFFPTKAGNFSDSIIFVVRSGGCTIHKKVYVRGRGYKAEVQFDVSSIDFGDVFLGQQFDGGVQVTNLSHSTINLTFYLKKGDGFILNNPKNLTLGPNAKGFASLSFRPTEEKTYYDEICFFENNCYEASCIPIQGKGVTERFSYIPQILTIDNVIGCQEDSKIVRIVNNSNLVQTLTDFKLDNPSGKFAMDPPTFPINVPLAKGEFIEFKVRYIPNDVTVDRSDKALLRYKTQDGQNWAANIEGNSVIPKLIITEETLFGTLELGEKVQKIIVIENISAFGISLDSLAFPDGFSLAYPSTWTSKMLNPKDTIHIVVEFFPTMAREYIDFIYAYSKSPCNSVTKGKVSGKGIIVPLDVPISAIFYGYVKQCDCLTRQVQLINESKVYDMKIDSIWIDDFDVVNGKPEFFSFTSEMFAGQGSKFPFMIPPLTRDSLKISYCPRGVSHRDSINHPARIHIQAQGAGWNRKFSTYLLGNQTLSIDYQRYLTAFAPTRVDTFATPRYLNITIPDVSVNPEKLPVRIDSISFIPDERVFYVSDSLGRNFPITINANDTLKLKITFKPRAVREYSAKMVLHISSPCKLTDTTHLLTGSGFAPAYGLSFRFDNFRLEPDTFKVITCETVDIPVYSSRTFPAEIVDIMLRYKYDTTKIEFVGAVSPYLNDTCKPYTPLISHKYLVDGSYFLLKNYCNVDSINPILIATFKPKRNIRDTIDIKLDSIKFDTEEVILYHIIAESDFGNLVILQPEMAVLNNVDFDSVEVLDCAERTIAVRNIGDIPISVDKIFNLPENVKLKSIAPPAGTMINVGDSATVTIEFCPRKKLQIDSISYIEAINPCKLLDSSRIEGISFAPEFPFYTDITTNFAVSDTVSTVIGDTITIPIYLEKDFARTINGVTYWLEDLSFEANFSYNPRVLKFISAKSTINGEFNFATQLKQINMKFGKVFNLKSGKIAELKFLTVVPDSLFTEMNVETLNFVTDSIMFLDIIPISEKSVLICNGSCNLTYMNYSTNLPILKQNAPNPFANSTKIEFTLQERAATSFRIFNSTGELVKTVLDGSIVMIPGNYTIEIDASEFENGIYYYELQNGIFRDLKKMVITK